jgi:hypothetical protein
MFYPHCHSPFVLIVISIFPICGSAYPLRNCFQIPKPPEGD